VRAEKRLFINVSVTLSDIVENFAEKLLGYLWSTGASG